jgi:hypothetical protein
LESFQIGPSVDRILFVSFIDEEFAMETVHEIRLAIARLSLTDRRNLISWFRGVESADDGVSEPIPAHLTPSEQREMSVEEYLAFEEGSTTRHEYIGGRLFAMTGATKRHSLISLNVSSALLAHLRGGPCTVLSPSYDERDARCSGDATDDVISRVY